MNAHRCCGRDEQEHPLASDNGKTLVATVAGKLTIMVGRLTARRESSKLDVCSEKKNKGRDLEFDTGDTKQGATMPMTRPRPRLP
ncbi:hypothetical protein [Rhizobium leguminosarum]|uniref:hypothetical protein n=1 Tax=Rhizobium leguminosarum TaxID=384 RepID=UPI0015B86995